MARLGIDFGTTNTVVAIYDRGLFSIVHHKAKTRAGTVIQEVFPSAILIEKSSDRKWFGLEADRRFAQLGPSAKCVFIPSLKRQLRNYAEGRKVAAGDRGGDGMKRRGSVPEPAIEPGELLTGFLRVLAESIRQSRSLAPDEPMETVITWPANANGAQRHITRQAFREAGFQVINTLNEPTASAIELADCLTAGPSKKKNAEPAAVAVFDLGGGTFDASVVWVDGQDFHVLASAGIEDLGFAQVDTDRLHRRGLPEVIFCPGKTAEQIVQIVGALKSAGQNAYATRADQEIYKQVAESFPEAVFHADARAITLDVAPAETPVGLVAVVSAGTSDIPVAAEAALTAERMGAKVERILDVGVAGLHRLMQHLDVLRSARAIVVVAGMEGALPSVVGGLLDKPIIAVPTSVGYGTSMNGLAALLAMLNSCVPGISVVNIDNGFGAGVAAAMINRTGENQQK